MRIDAQAGKGEFAHIGAAYGDHARLPEETDDRRIAAGGRVGGQDDGPRRRRQPLDVEKILPRNRNAVQQTQRAPFPQTFGRCERLLHSPVFEQRGEDRLIGIIFDGFEHRLGHIDRIGGTALDEDGKLGDGHRTEGFAHGTVLMRDAVKGLTRNVRASQSLTFFCIYWYEFLNTEFG